MSDGDTRTIGVRVSDEVAAKYAALPPQHKRIVLEVIRQTLENMVSNIEQLLQQHSITINNNITVITSGQTNKVKCEELEKKYEAVLQKNERIKELIQQYVKKEIDIHEFADNVLYVYKNYLMDLGYLR